MHKSIIALLVIVIVIIASAVIWLTGSLNNLGVMHLSGPTSLTLNGNTPVIFNGNEYVLSVAKAPIGGSTAYVYIAQSPIFLNPVLNVTLHLNTATNINLGSSLANVQMTLTAITPAGVSINIAPLPQYLQLAPNASAIRTINLSAGSSYSAGSGTTTQSTSTISSGGGSSTTATSVSTTAYTTISQSQLSNQALYSTLNQSSYYGLMLNYSKLYAKANANCTSLLYSNSYLSYYNKVPSGAGDYYNSSQLSPYAQALNITNSGSRYTADFITKMRSQYFNNTVAAVIVVDTSTGAVVNQTIGAHGIFQGQSFSQLKANYQSALSINGACGIWVLGASH